MLQPQRTRTFALALLASSLLGTLAFTTPAQAEKGDRRGGFELFYGLPEGPLTRDAGEGVGLRIRAPFGERWSVEASWTHDEGDDNFFGSFFSNSFDNEYVDLSIRYDLVTTERLKFFVFGGPGWYSVEVPYYHFNSPVDPFGFLIPSERDEEGGSIHGGVGLEISLGERFYLRPDVRHRTLEGFDFDQTLTESSFAVGWRF